MSLKDGRNYLYLIWKDNKSRRQYIVGQLTKNGQFEFSYGHEVEKAIVSGFKPLVSFEDIERVYKSDNLFPVFSSRLPDKKRRGIEKILEKYNLESYDEYMLLKRSGARLPIDNLEFIDPILDRESPVKRKFYLAGVRHYLGCEGNDCNQAVSIQCGDELLLEFEDSNEYDSYAIKVFLKKTKKHVGYVPRYYSEGVYRLIKLGYCYQCTVKEVNMESECHECIVVDLILTS